jgi:hypothetical protein
MSHKLNSGIAVIGIDIGKNSFHIVGHDKRGAIMLRQRRGTTTLQKSTRYAASRRVAAGRLRPIFRFWAFLFVRSLLSASFAKRSARRRAVLMPMASFSASYSCIASAGRRRIGPPPGDWHQRVQWCAETLLAHSDSRSPPNG